MVSRILCVPSTVKFPLTCKAPDTLIKPVLDIFNAPLDAIVKFVPSPSIFSPSSPNTKPTLLGKLTSAVAVKLISAPDVIVKFVSSPSIFSPVPNVSPMFAGIITSAPAVNLMLPVPFVSIVMSALELSVDILGPLPPEGVIKS